MSAPIRPSARCRKLLLRISRYLDGELTAAQRHVVEQHVHTCSCCGTMAARLRSTIAACRAQGGRRPPRDVMLRARARIRALLGRHPTPTIPAPRRRRTGTRLAESATAKR